MHSKLLEAHLGQPVAPTTTAPLPSPTPAVAPPAASPVQAVAPRAATPQRATAPSTPAAPAKRAPTPTAKLLAELQGSVPVRDAEVHQLVAGPVGGRAR